MIQDFSRGLSPGNEPGYFALLRALIDNLPDSVYVKDVDGRYVVNNAAHLHVLGAESQEEVVGKTDFDYYPEDLAGRYHAEDQVVLRAGHPLVDQERPVRNGSGDQVWVSTTRMPLRDGAGRVAGLLSISRNITGRKQVEQRFQLLVEQTPAIVYIQDVETLDTLYDSPQIESMLGYPHDTYLRDPGYWIDVLHPDDRERVLADEAKLKLEGATEYLSEYRCVARDGGVVWVRDEAVLVRDGDGTPRYWQGVISDITERKRTEGALRESEERFRSAFQHAPVGVALVGLDRRFLRVNRAVCEILGYTERELLLKTTPEITHPEDLERTADRVSRILEDEGGGHIVEKRYVRGDGGVVWVQSSVSLVRDSQGAPSHFVSMFQDITRRKDVEQKLKETETRYRTLVEQIPTVTYTIEAENSTLTYVSPQHEAIFGYTPEECMAYPEHWIDTLHPDDHERVLAEDERSEATGEPFRAEYRQLAKDGRVVWVRDEAVLVRDEAGRPLYWQGVQYDITERKNLEERLRHRAFHDPLTGLPNRTLFLELSQKALTRAGRDRGSVAVLFVDLDNFKTVNDSLGHEAGNDLLMLVAEILRSCVRPDDTIARLFGDEFAILLENVGGAAEVARIANRLTESLRVPFRLNGRDVFVSASIGIDYGSTGQSDPEELLRNADLAMYASKSKGKSRYEFFAPSLKARVLERMDLENDLHQAVEREELVVHYQPIVSLETGEIESLEALARWRHPERGLVPPNVFVPIAEQTSLIMTIGRWVLREASRQARGWQEKLGKDLLPSISVNLSPAQLLSHPEFVIETLQEAGLEPSLLRLEITERVVVSDTEVAVGKIERLREMGIKFVLDDFGTGYSCLNYLKWLPADLLKIDRSFVEGLAENRRDAAIVSGTITLAHELGLRVVAEGVEFPEQLTELRQMGCDLVQGNHFSEPISGEQVLALLKSVNRAVRHTD